MENDEWNVTHTTHRPQVQKKIDGVYDRIRHEIEKSRRRYKYHPVFRWVGKELAIENTDTFTEKEVLSETTQSDFWRSISNGNGMGLQAQGNRLVPGRT